MGNGLNRCKVEFFPGSLLSLWLKSGESSVVAVHEGVGLCNGFHVKAEECLCRCRSASV